MDLERERERDRQIDFLYLHTYTLKDNNAIYVPQTGAALTIIN